jgi:hypothetical protein
MNHLTSIPFNPQFHLKFKDLSVIIEGNEVKHAICLKSVTQSVWKIHLKARE